MIDQADNSIADRKAWMGLLARAPQTAARDLWGDTGLKPSFKWVRAPEVGAVMVRGRTGATGAPFNLGEMTVTRCSLVLQDGTVGHGYVQGRSKNGAEVAALIDALMQTVAADQLRHQVLIPLQQQMAAVKSDRAAKAAATKVEFFTMVRGEN